MIAIYRNLILTVLPAYPSFWENFYFKLTGLFVVLVTLGLIALILSGMGWFFKTFGDRGKHTVSRIIPDKLITPVSEKDPEIVAVITAAVYSEISDSHRIISIQPAVGQTRADLYRQAWSFEGRRQLFGSHKVR
jgi:Na+-transporting methylmalonyl-CoA/oxaloacetate decarboxylase gamma subunit